MQPLLKLNLVDLLKQEKLNGENFWISDGHDDKRTTSFKPPYISYV